MITLKSLILEYSTKQVVLTISRDVIKFFKKNIGKNTKYDSFETLPGKHMGGEPIEFDLEIGFEPVKKGTYKIEGASSFDEVQIHVWYNPEKFPEVMNDFIAELKETIRHEIEHVYQDQRDNQSGGRPAGTPFYKYLLLKHEIPAHIRGLNTRAKTKKITLGQAIEEFFKEKSKDFDSKREIDIVRREWHKWIKKNLPKTKI